MISAWANLSATTFAGVNAQMTTTLAATTDLQIIINDFLKNVGTFFSVIFSQFRILPFTLNWY